MRRLNQYAAAALICGLAGAIAVPSTASAQVLIINGSSTTSEPGTTSDITNNLTSLFNAIGVTPTVVDGVPASLAGFSQVWDLRFSNSSPLTASDQSLYLNFLQGGGGMFVMGENQSFAVRNTSVLALIAAAGGGTLNFVVPGSTESVDAPFTGPNAVSTVTYEAPGGVSSAGTGQFITDDGAGNGAGVAFGVGTLANAPHGGLTTIFDVNFMQDNNDLPDAQNLTKNLIGFVNVVAPPVSSVPEPASFVLLGSGLLAIGGVARTKKRRQV